ncbi:MAG: hypothetical protein GY694_16770 [Gammaproteobacteria bacterium]|nr:hypothetical protein [Gammaproteobacteria bacterium]
MKSLFNLKNQRILPFPVIFAMAKKSEVNRLLLAKKSEVNRLSFTAYIKESDFRTWSKSIFS